MPALRVNSGTAKKSGDRHINDHAPSSGVPMLLYTRRTEPPLDVAVQCPHDTDPRKHGRAVMLDQQERLHRGLPLNGVRFQLPKNVEFAPVPKGFGVLLIYVLRVSDRKASPGHPA